VTASMNPFEALGLPTRADLDDEQVRTAWGRSEAHADLTAQASLDAQDPVTAPLPVIPARHPPPGRPPGARPAHRLAGLGQLPSRIRRGRPLRLLLRAVIAAVLALAVLQLIPASPAAPADTAGLVLWFVLTGRKDLAPPPEQ